MNKKELVGRVTEVLKENDVRKYVTAQKTVLHISDDAGNNSDFTIKKSERGLLFSNKDVNRIIDACIAVIEDSLRHGEEVSVMGFGTLGLNLRAARQTKHPETGEIVDVPARFVPKFNSGNTLKMAAKVYELSLKNRKNGGGVIGD